MGVLAQSRLIQEALGQGLGTCSSTRLWREALKGAGAVSTPVRYSPWALPSRWSCRFCGLHPWKVLNLVSQHGSREPSASLQITRLAVVRARGTSRSCGAQARGLSALLRACLDGCPAWCLQAPVHRSQPRTQAARPLRLTRTSVGVPPAPARGGETHTAVPCQHRSQHRNSAHDRAPF